MRFSTRIARIIAIGAMTLVLGASLAAAQETFDPTADPGFGGWNFNEGVLPDPFIVSIIGGGSIDASTVDPLCNGYIAGAPDFRVNWNGSAPSLRFLFVSDGDATMVVRGPDGTTLCNDDSFGLDPLVEALSPTGGEYNVWVGSYSADEFIPGYLMVSEQPGTVAGPIRSSVLAGVFSAETADVQTDSGTTTANDLNPDAAPHFGSVTLQPGTLSQPHTVNVLSGGSTNVGLLGLGFGCLGYASSAPDFSFELTGAAADLIVGFTADDFGDTTLIVRNPEGRFACNDDTNGLNPEMTLTNATAGEYDVWVGNYDGEMMVSGTLSIGQGPVGPLNNNVPPVTTPEVTGPIGVTGATSVPPVEAPAIEPTPTRSK